MYTGPKFKHDDLVFGYDDGYNATNTSLARGKYSNGPPHTNLMRQIGPNYTNTSTTNLTAISGTETVFIPTVGERVSKYIDYYNNHNNAGSTCCMNLFSYHTNDKIPVEASTNYTYSIIYKHTNESAQGSNYMYRYEYNSSGTFQSIEGGVHSASRRTHLGDGWYHAWGGFTTGSSTTQLACYTFAYDYGTNINRIHVAAVSLVKNTTGGDYLIIPPHFMLTPNTTANAAITNTGSLIDLKSEEDVNLTNASITERGQLTFDGTDDKIDFGSSLVSKINEIANDATFEIVFKSNETNEDYAVLLGWGQGNNNYSSIGLGNLTGGYNNESLHLILNAGDTQVHVREGHAAFKDNAYHHVVVTTGINKYAIWVDGVEKSLTFQQGSQTTIYGQITGYISSSGNIQVGQRPYNGGNGHFQGNIPVVKIYSDVLSDEEILKNYQNYKRRFNI